MSYSRGEKHTTEMNNDEFAELTSKLKELGQVNKMPQRTKAFLAGIRKWDNGHGKLVSKQVYWVNYWHAVYCM
jgi:hypothetical protein